jgi:large subunit ribosomal protein L1
MVNGKNYKEKAKLVDREKRYSPAEALKLVKEVAFAKFDESIDLAMCLGADPKKHSIRGTVMLPGGSGKKKKIAAIVKTDKVKEAKDAGAAVVGGDDLVEKIQKGFLGFDVLVVTPDMMGSVGKLGKVLGPKGLMPNPKIGTVTNDIGKTVKEFMSGKVEFKMDKTGALHMVLGKVSFEEGVLLKNFTIALRTIMQLKPSGLKRNYVESITISSSMGPGVKIDHKAAVDNVDKEI